MISFRPNSTVHGRSRWALTASGYDRNEGFPSFNGSSWPGQPIDGVGAIGFVAVARGWGVGSDPEEGSSVEVVAPLGNIVYSQLALKK